MSEITEQTVATISSLIDDIITMALTENPSNTKNTTNPNQSNYHLGFLEDNHSTLSRSCGWCKELRYTNPDCERQLQIEYDCCKKCLNCNETFDTIREASYHELNCPWKSLTDYTGFTFPCERENEQSDRLFCGVCGINFETQEQFVAHNTYQCLINCNGYYCESCGMRFDTNKQLDEHNPEKCQPNFYCRSCGIDFKTQEHLDEHNPEKCWVDNMSYDCHCCGRYFDTQAELDKHDVNNCWNEYTLSTMDDDRELWYHYEQELAEERMEEFREEMREARMEKAADTEAERRYTPR